MGPDPDATKRKPFQVPDPPCTPKPPKHPPPPTPSKPGDHIWPDPTRILRKILKR